MSRTKGFQYRPNWWDQMGRGEVKQVNLADLKGAKDFTPDEARENIAFRVQMNLKQTGHPFHHRTADGTIVNADPTLEYLINHKLTDALPTVPVDREHYGFNPYADESGISEAAKEERHKRTVAAMEAHEREVAVLREQGMLTDEDLPFAIGQESSKEPPVEAPAHPSKRVLH